RAPANLDHLGSSHVSNPPRRAPATSLPELHSQLRGALVQSPPQTGSEELFDVRAHISKERSCDGIGRPQPQRHPRPDEEGRPLQGVGGAMKRFSRRSTVGGLLALTVLAGVSSAGAQTDPLPSWNDGPAKQAILTFVKETTDTGSASFVPPEQ